MMNLNRLARTVVPATAMVMILGACSGADNDDDTSTPAPTAVATNDAAAGGQVAGSVLRVNWGGFPENWAPGAEMESGYMRVPYENLTQLTPDGDVEPMLAQSWEQTDEALTLFLQEGVTFHDGTPFDAEAVKVNLETIANTPGPYSGPFQVIESIEVVDELTVQLNLTQATPSMVTTLSTRAAPMASAAAIADGSIAQAPVGTGPWMYSSDDSISGTRMAFVSFPDYWGEVPAFETVQLFGIQEDNAATGAMTGGELDITDSESDQLSTYESAGNFDIITYPAIRNNVLFFDRGPGGLFEDVAVRQAACYALDENVIAELDSDATASTQHFQEGEPGYNGEISGYPQDLDMAAQLFAEAGSPSIVAEMMSTSFNDRQIQVYAQQMGEIGMDITVQNAPPPQFFSTWNTGAYPLGLGGNDELTPYDWYTSWFAADAASNPAGVESDELKAAADAAIAAGNSDEADGLWAEVTKIIADEALTCAHIASEEIVAVNTDTVAGAAAPSQPWETVLINYRDLRPAGS